MKNAQTKLNEFPDAPKPDITFIVVSKRHHQRFFPTDSNATDRNGNCLPGSVFDEGIAHPVLFDFYLQSQAPILGSGCIHLCLGPEFYRLRSGSPRTLCRDAQRESRAQQRHVGGHDICCEPGTDAAQLTTAFVRLVLYLPACNALCLHPGSHIL